MQIQNNNSLQDFDFFLVAIWEPIVKSIQVNLKSIYFFQMNSIQMEGIQLNLNFLLIKVMNLKKLKKQLQVEKCQE